MRDCLFCKIVKGELPATRVLESPDWVAFRDIDPKAPVHVLVVPRRHIATLNELTPGDAGLVGQLVLAAREIAQREGIAGPGYRLVLNCNAGAGQTVFHIHLHLLGGRPFNWPPG
ncbi:MAG: histidine triad nucleotide-binding protein [Gammaproteobacteria bacterium]